MPADKRTILWIGGLVLAAAVVLGAFLWIRTYFIDPIRLPDVGPGTDERRTDTIAQAVRHLFPDTNDNEVHIELFSAAGGFEPGTVYRRDGRKVIVSPGEGKLKVQTREDVGQKLIVSETRRIGKTVVLGAKLLEMSGDLDQNSQVEFECKGIVAQSAKIPDLNSWLQQSLATIKTALGEKHDWEMDPPLIVYQSVIGQYYLHITAYHDGMARIALKDNPILKGELEEKGKGVNRFRRHVEKPRVFAFCACAVKPGGTLNDPVKDLTVGDMVNTDNSSDWEKAPLVLPKKK